MLKSLSHKILCLLQNVKDTILSKILLIQCSNDLNLGLFLYHCLKWRNRSFFTLSFLSENHTGFLEEFINYPFSLLLREEFWKYIANELHEPLQVNAVYSLIINLSMKLRELLKLLFSLILAKFYLGKRLSVKMAYSFF